MSFQAVLQSSITNSTVPSKNKAIRYKNEMYNIDDIKDIKYLSMRE